jgi:arsenate reductase (thioredoxin)
VPHQMGLSATCNLLTKSSIDTAKKFDRRTCQNETKDYPVNILFMCVANSARSQLAEGLARQIFPQADIRSAGSQPGHLNPVAVSVMNEIGIDISDHYSKSYEDLPHEFIAALDYVVTLCAEEVCPVIVSRARKLHWPHADPVSKEPISDADLQQRFREARDNILERLIEFRKEIQS